MSNILIGPKPTPEKVLAHVLEFSCRRCRRYVAPDGKRSPSGCPVYERCKMNQPLWANPPLFVAPLSPKIIDRLGQLPIDKA